MPNTPALHPLDVAVVGGGLGGLAAATLLARAGRAVTLYEKASGLGGRAATQARGGVLFNQGPHALYRSGAAAALLAELGVGFTGGAPRTAGAYALDGGVPHTLPGGFVSLITTRLFGLGAKLEVARLLGTLPRLDPRPLDGMSVAEWLDGHVRHAPARRLLRALVRLTSYADDPPRASAGAALAQLKRALGAGVLYVDGGWQTLADGLSAAATAAGVRVRTGVRVAAIEHDGVVRGVRLDDGTFHPVGAAIVAASPAAALGVVARGGDTPLARWAADAIPVHVACVDVALARLPRPRTLFALGIDRPLYYSVHSAYARLAPAGTAVIQVAKYLGADGAGAADEHDLEEALDLLQPGWRDVVVWRRALPRMVVAEALVTARAGGTAGRPGPAVPGVRGLCVVGDWVGPEGMLADAALASARQAAALLGALPAAAAA
ncbi:MAG TPA: FAD-dependent oxidoreductase [Candidatus Binatia bacterium]|nr:FAD-dependent oxidoreductase [Candidatus Binatia bacterium]